MKTTKTATCVLALAVTLCTVGCSGIAPPPSGGGGPDGTGGTLYGYQSYTMGFSVSGFGAATIYYPTNAPAPLSGVVVTPGFTELQLKGWGSYLASRGFVTMTIDTLTTGDLPPQRSTEMLAAVGALRAENARPASPLSGKLDVNSMAIMGHSMGGGGTLIAADTNPAGIKAAIPLCPWYPGGNFNQDRVPTLIMAAENDTLAGVTGQTRPFYAGIPNTTQKAYIEFRGADHFVVNDPNMGANGQIGGQYARAWLEIFLHGNDSYRATIANSAVFSNFGSTL